MVFQINKDLRQCIGKCKDTPGCKSFVHYPDKPNEELKCFLHGSLGDQDLVDQPGSNVGYYDCPCHMVKLMYRAEK